VVVPALDGIKIVDIAAGAYHTLAVSVDGDVYAWGDNTYHQLGNCST
jgi:alpha-tubulin suppressor-like RCC1 family protein